MKLKDWADKQGISYLTAWRWFKAGDARLADAYQSDSGTIIIPDDNFSEPSMNNIQDSDIMAVVLKKTVEFSKNEYAIEDFTAWLLSNFTLKLKGSTDFPKYSRVKPKSEEVQKHFQQFIKPKGEKPKPNMFVTTDSKALDDLMAKSDDLTAQELVEELEEEINKIGAEGGVLVNPSDAPEVEELMKDISSAMTASSSSIISNNVTYDDIVNKYGYDNGNITEGVVTRSVDLTPQQINYTGFISPALSNTSCASYPLTAGAIFSTATLASASFQPTQKELESANHLSSIAEKPKRGRKPTKNIGKK